MRILLLVANVQNFLMDRFRDMYIQKNVICAVNIELWERVNTYFLLQFPHNRQQTRIKMQLRQKEDEKLFVEIKDLDLIAKEFKYHDACYREYSLFILVMCILLQRISNPRDFVRYISGNMCLSWKELIAQNLLLRGMIKKVLFHASIFVHWSKS